MDRIIEVKVFGNHLTKDNKNAGVQHEANVTALRIEFDAGWEGYAKKVTFWDAKGLNPVERTLTADLLEDITKSILIYIVPIPGEPMAEAGEMTFVIDGWEDGKRQRSLSDKLIVKPAPFIEQADQPIDPTPTQAEQLQKQIDTLLGDMQEQAIIATTAAAEAKVSEEAAAQSATEAANSAYESAYSANEAAFEARNAERFCNRAENSAAEALASANAAANSSANAKASSDAAARSATEVNVGVAAAAQSAANAAASAKAAKDSEEKAKASEVASGLNQANAQSSEENAVLQSQNAQRYATEALANKNAAANSAAAALAAKEAAEQAKNEAREIAGGDFATISYVDNAVANAGGDIDGGTF